MQGPPVRQEVQVEMYELQETKEHLLLPMHELQAAVDQLKVMKAELHVPVMAPADQVQPLLVRAEPVEPVHKEMLRNKRPDVVTRLHTVKPKVTIVLFTIELLIQEHLVQQEVAKAQELFKV